MEAGATALLFHSAGIPVQLIRTITSVFVSLERHHRVASLKYELRNRNPRFLCSSLSCGDLLIHKNSSAPDLVSAEGTLALRDALRTPSQPGALAKLGESLNVVKDRMAPHVRREET